MTEQKLVKWLNAGYPHFKEYSGLSAWILPSRSFARIADEFGDNGILEMSQPLRFADDIEKLLEKAPDPDTLPDETWQIAVMCWPPLCQVEAMVEVCLEATSMIISQFHRGQLKAEPALICRSMPVLGFAPFVPQGKLLVEELASILKSDADRPSELMRGYAKAVVGGDMATVKQVDESIAKHSQWVEWAAIFVERAINFPYTPRPIGVTPLISAEIARVLAEMIKETQNDESGRDYPKYQDDQMCAQ